MTKEMEQMEHDELMLLDLPTIVIEEILLHLNLRDRKNIRLTSKRLYELCNCTRICMKEKIIWRKIDASVLTIGRRCYNLVLNGDNGLYGTKINPLRSTIVEFFKLNGAKMRSLVIEKIYFAEGFLEPLIISCEDLRSLTLSLRNSFHSSSLDYFTLESNTITRPTVIYLELILPEHQPSKYFSRMLSVFPNVKQLKIEMEQLQRYYSTAESKLEIAQECSAIFDDIMECGSNLKSLGLKNIPLRRLFAKGSQFSKALSNLKDLAINFNNNAARSEPEKLYSCFPNLSSLELFNTKSFQLIRVLENTQLNSLKLFNRYSYPLVLNEECFKALMSSKLKILDLRADEIEGLPMTGLDYPLEANTTVTDLYLSFGVPSLELSVQLFSTYFRGLVHLSIRSATNSTLQHIFKYQKNLRSLEIGECFKCTQEGFCGSKDDRFNYSINNLQKLEHLSIGFVSFEIIASDDFKSAFNSPLLEYLHIDCCYPKDYFGLIVHPDLYENLTHLRALRITDTALPSREKISSLFKNLKHLNYLRINMRKNDVVFMNSKEFSINIESYKYNYCLGDSYYDKKLDQILLRKNSRGLEKKLSIPKISSYEINWIEA